MTIQQLEYILEVNRCGTIAQAAKKLHVTHACISNAVRTLEEELGFAIFERSWHGVVPTAQGAKALEHARTICEHQKLLVQSAQEIRTVRIETGVNPVFSDVFLSLLNEYKGRTDVTFSHRQSRSKELSNNQSAADRLLSFETDIFVDFIQGEGCQLHLRKRAAFQKKLSIQVRAAIPAVLYIGPGHPLYHKEDLPLSDFAQDTFVDTSKALVAKSGMLRRALGFSPARTLLADESRTRRELVAAGHGYSFGPQFPDYLNEQYGFRTIPIPTLPYYLISLTNTARSVAPEAQRYLELLDAQIASLRMDQ